MILWKLYASTNLILCMNRQILHTNWQKCINPKIPCAIHKFHGFSRFSMGVIKFHGFSRYFRLVDTLISIYIYIFQPYQTLTVPVLGHINLVASLADHLSLAQVVHVLQATPGLAFAFAHNFSNFRVVLQRSNGFIVQSFQGSYGRSTWNKFEQKRFLWFCYR